MLESIIHHTYTHRGIRTSRDAKSDAAYANTTGDTNKTTNNSEKSCFYPVTSAHYLRQFRATGHHPALGSFLLRLVFSTPSTSSRVTRNLNNNGKAPPVPTTTKQTGVIGFFALSTAVQAKPSQAKPAEHTHKAFATADAHSHQDFRIALIRWCTSASAVDKGRHSKRGRTRSSSSSSNGWQALQDRTRWGGACGQNRNAISKLGRHW